PAARYAASRSGGVTTSRSFMAGYGATRTVNARLPSTWVISLTAFAADESLDEQGLRAHLRRMKAAGIGVYVGGSGSGEAYTLTPDEMRRVLEIGLEEVGPDVRAMGVEPRSARDMVALGELCAEVGVPTMQVYSLDQGHGNRPRPDELDRYLRDV